MYEPDNLWDPCSYKPPKKFTITHLLIAFVLGYAVAFIIAAVLLYYHGKGVV